MLKLVPLFALLWLPAAAEFQFQFDQPTGRWTLANSQIQAVFELSAGGSFNFISLLHRPTGEEWSKFGNGSPIRLKIGDRWLDHNTVYRLVSQQAGAVPRDGFRQTIILEEAGGAGRVTLELELYPNLPVLRYGVRYQNLDAQTVYVTEADPTSWSFADLRQTYRALRVEQWFPVSDPANFERLVDVIDGSPEGVTVQSGAYGRHCSWLAFADSRWRGLVAGWEFDGRASVTLRQDTATRRLWLEGNIPDLHHPVEPGQSFEVPRAFLAPFYGDWDEAAYLTQRFVEHALSKQLPGNAPFPFVSWDSWAYGQDLNEATLRREAELAASLGFELFVIDLGWARHIGDWHADPLKFPSGLRAFSDYVHSLGMKFGLHFAFAESDARAPVMRDNFDWTSSEDYDYYGAHSLCLAHQPARNWIIEEAIRMIDEYNIDWILQDGENMVKECRKEDHTHHPDDSNYANAVDGLGYVLKEIQRRRPQVAWENCENGGNLMTFQMVQNYVTSIVNDASGALGSRQAVYGATYPLPPRYTDRYMPEQELSSYVTRSYMFGGPWIFMNKLGEMSREDLDFAAAEIARFKKMRSIVRDGKVLHLTAAPADGQTDAIGSYQPSCDCAVAIVTRDQAPANYAHLRIREFNPARSYRVSFADDSRILTMTGDQIAVDGIQVRLPASRSAEIVYIDPLR